MEIGPTFGVVLVMTLSHLAGGHPYGGGHHRRHGYDDHEDDHQGLLVLPPLRYPNAISQSAFRHLDHDEYGRPHPVQTKDSNDYFNFSGVSGNLDPERSVFSGYTRDADPRANRAARAYLARGFRGARLPFDPQGDRGYVFNRSPNDLYHDSHYF